MHLLKSSTIWGSLIKSYPLVALITRALSISIITIVSDKGRSSFLEKFKVVESLHCYCFVNMNYEYFYQETLQSFYILLFHQVTCGFPHQEHQDSQLVDPSSKESAKGSLNESEKPSNPPEASNQPTDDGSPANQPTDGKFINRLTFMRS